MSFLLTTSDDHEHPYEDADEYRVDQSGALVVTSNRSRTIYAPSAWLKVVEEVP
jgi:hypothetical protein